MTELTAYWLTVSWRTTELTAYWVNCLLTDCELTNDWVNCLLTDCELTNDWLVLLIYLSLLDLVLLCFPDLSDLFGWHSFPAIGDNSVRSPGAVSYRRVLRQNITIDVIGQLSAVIILLLLCLQATFLIRLILLKIMADWMRRRLLHEVYTKNWIDVTITNKIRSR